MSATLSQFAAESSAALELETVPCLACGSWDYTPILRSRDHLTDTPAEFAVVQCRACQLCFTNPRPTEMAISQFYPSQYAPYAAHTPRSSWRDALRERLQRAILRSHFGYHPQPVRTPTRLLAKAAKPWLTKHSLRAEWLPYRPGGRLIDFGCGAGDFLQQMQARGWNVEGIDMCQSVAKEVTRRTGIPVHVGTLPHDKLAPQSCDAITMWHALEHVHQPRSVLTEARTALRPGGCLVVAVPNFDSWARRIFGPAWFCLELPRHLTHFTPQSLAGMIEATGFRVRRIAHVSQDGWMRASAQRGRDAGLRHWSTRCTWKPLARRVTRWIDLTGQGDSIVITAIRD